MFYTIILITIIVGTLTWLLFRSRRSSQKWIDKFSRRNVKYISMRNPFVSVIRKERLELIKDEIIKREGKVWGFDMMNSVTILLAEPELVQLVLSKEFICFTNRRSLKLPDPILGLILSNTEDEQWKRLRSIVTPTFSSGSLRRMKPRIDSTVHKLLNNFEESIKKNEEVDVKHLFGAFTMDTIISVAFGVKVDSLAEPDNPIIKNVKSAFSTDMSVKTFATIMLLMFLPKVAQALGIRYKSDITDFFKEFSEEIIKRKKDELKSNNPMNSGKATSFIELLLEAETEGENSQETENNKISNKYMSTEEMVAQCIQFFLAGYETTSTTITMACYLLALNPEIQNKLYQEIETFTGEDPIESITFDPLSQFKYLSAVIDETLRIYPPATETEREANRDIVLQNEDRSIKLNIKKDDVIHIPIYLMHRDAFQIRNNSIRNVSLAYPDFTNTLTYLLVQVHGIA